MRISPLGIHISSLIRSPKDKTPITQDYQSTAAETNIFCLAYPYTHFPLVKYCASLESGTYIKYNLSRWAWTTEPCIIETYLLGPLISRE